MTTNSKRIGKITKLQRRINAWSYIVELANKIVKFANERYCKYSYERDELISELKTGACDIELEARKEYNRKHFEFDL